MTHKKIVVTGAAGMVGSHIVEAAVEAGHEVVALIRSHADPTALPEGVDVRRGDLRDPHFVKSVVQGVDAVIHAAAIVDLAAEYRDLEGSNVEAVRVLVEASVEHEVAHFILVSTASVYAAQQGLIDERAPRRATSAYEQTKIDAEDVLLEELEAATGTHYTILRPAMIYGKRGRSFIGKLASLPPILAQLLAYLPGFLGGPRSNWVHAGDVARAALTVLGRDEAYGKCFNVADHTPVALGELVTYITAAHGLSVGPMLPWPPVGFVRSMQPVISSRLVLGPVNALLRTGWKRLRRRYQLQDALEPKIDPAFLWTATQDMIFATDQLRALGWTPKWSSVHEGFPEVLDWYRQNQWLPDLRSGATPTDHSGVRLRSVEHLKGDAIDIYRPDEQRTMELMVEVDTPLLALIAGREATVNGSITVEGVCKNAPLKGTLSFPLVSERRMVYEFGFVSDEGVAYRFMGVRSLTPAPWQWFVSGTHLSFEIVDEKGRQVYRGELELELRELVKFLASQRIGYVRES